MIKKLKEKKIFLQFKKTKGLDPLPVKHQKKKKIVIILIILILIYSIFVSITSQQLGIFLPTLILCICLWQIGKSPKKKPYEYVYDDMEQKEDDGKIHEMQPSYLPNTRYDQAYVPNYGIPALTQRATLVTPPSKTKIYKDLVYILNP